MNKSLIYAEIPTPPPLTRCPHCGSMYCGPIRCRFTLKGIAPK